MSEYLGPERRHDNQRRAAVDNMENLSAMTWFRDYPGGRELAEKELRERATTENHPAHHVTPKRYCERVYAKFLKLVEAEKQNV